MRRWSTYWAHCSVLVLALVEMACSARPLEPTDGDTSDPPPWPCGEQTVLEHDAQESGALVLEDWTVAEVLALVSDVNLGLEWTGWDVAYLGPQPPASYTDLTLQLALDSAIVSGYTHEIDDDFCVDRIEIIVDVALTTGDGMIMGSTDARITLVPKTEETSFSVAVEATTLNLSPTWPASETRPVPDATLIWMELTTPTLGLDDLASGALEVHWVWTIEVDDVPAHVEDSLELAVIG